MSEHVPSPLEQLIDALQVALPLARALDVAARDHASDAADLRAAIERAGRLVRELGPTPPERP